MKDADDCRSLLLLFTNFVCLFVFSSFENFFCVFFSSRTPVAYSRCQPKKKQAFGLFGYSLKLLPESLNEPEERHSPCGSAGCGSLGRRQCYKKAALQRLRLH
jgi:hypothetical protein